MEAAAQETAEVGITVLGVALTTDLLAPGTLLTVASAIFFFLLKLVKDEKDRIRLFFLLEETPWWPAYGQLLAAMSSAFDRFFGKKLFAWRSFDRCLVLAFIYPFVAALVWITISWSGSTEKTTIFGWILIAELEWRPISQLLFSGSVLIVAVRVVKRWIEPRNLAVDGQQARWAAAEHTVYFLLGVVAVATVPLAVVITGAEGEARADVGTVAIFMTGFIVVVVAAAGFAARAGVAAVIGAGAAAVTVVPVLIEIEAGSVAVIFMFLFLGVPIINAALDWPSWGASRWLMRRLERDAERGAWPAIILHVAIDLALAVFFLATLTAMFATVSLLVLPISDSEWREITVLRDAEIDPWGDGFWLTAMLLSTLVPTVFHLAAAVGALVVVRPPLRRIPLRYLDDPDPSTLERWITAGYLTAWILLALGAAGAAIYGIVYGLSYHGHTLWTLVFNLADYLVISAN